MAKRRSRKIKGGHPAKRSRLRSIDGGAEPLADDPRQGPSVPLEGRPEYEAHMAAWRKHGCPRPGPGPSLS